MHRSSDTLDPPEPTSVLLRRFARAGSEEAFAGLVRRYGRLVYETALRRTADAATAEDVSQIVFADLARRAPAMAEDNRLGAWLHRRALMAASDVMKSERRRTRRESAVATSPVPNGNETTAWLEVAPVLDESLGRLKPGDRLVLIQRFLEGRSVKEVGETLGIGEDAAQKRIRRALEKLRSSLTRRGVTLSAAVLAGLMGGHSAATIPEGFAARTTLSVLRKISGLSETFWRFLPVAVPAGAGVLAAAMLSAVPQLQRPQSEGAPGAPHSRPFEAATPRQGYAPGMTLKETVEALADSFVKHPGYPPQIIGVERMALAASVPREKSAAALDMLISAIQKRGPRIDPNAANVLGDTLVMNVLRDDPGSMLDRLKSTPTLWLQSLTGPRFYEALADQPAALKTDFARRILDDPVLCLDSSIQSLADRIYADGDGDGLADLDRRNELFSEALERVQKGGGYGWAKVAALTLHDEAGCKALLEAGTGLPAKDSDELRGTILQRWSRLSVNSLMTWSESQPEPVRQLAAARVFESLPARLMDDSKAGGMPRAEWVADTFPGYAGSIGTLIDRAAAEPEGWGDWLARHPEIIRAHASDMESMLNERLPGSALPPSRRDEFLNRPVSERLKPGLLAWRRADPAAVEAILKETGTGTFEALHNTLRQLAVETP